MVRGELGVENAHHNSIPGSFMSSDEDDRVHALAAPQPLPQPVTQGVPSGARRIAFLATLLTAPAMLAGWTVGGMAMAGSVLFGGLLSLVNFWLISRLVVSTTSSDDLSPGQLVFQLMAKLAVFGLLLALAVFGLGLDPMGLLLGLGVLFAAVPLSLFSDWMAAR